MSPKLIKVCFLAREVKEVHEVISWDPLAREEVHA